MGALILTVALFAVGAVAEWKGSRALEWAFGLLREYGGGLQLYPGARKK